MGPLPEVPALRIETDIQQNPRTPSPTSPPDDIDGWLDIRTPPPPAEPVTNQETDTNSTFFPLASVSRVADWTPLDLGHMDVICSNCQALHWRNEAMDPRAREPRFMVCCKHGDVHIPLLKPLSECLQRLLHSADTDGHAFRQHIR